MTPAINAVQQARVAFTLHQYEHDKASHAYGAEAAEKLGVAPAQVFKTLLARLDGRELVVAVIPVAQQLNLKRLAACLGGKGAEMAPPADAERATGYVVGGISPLGQKRRLRTALDATALAFPTLFVSAGRRGLELELAPAALAQLTGACIGELTR